MKAAALLLPLLLAACGGRNCPLLLVNASSQAVEQVYVARPGAGWGADLVAPGELAPGASLPLRLPSEGPHTVRTVWANGRAAEMPGVEACAVTRLVVGDGTLRAE